MNEGIKRRAAYLILPLTIALFSCIGLHFEIINYYSNVNIGDGTFMDYWIYLVQGQAAYKFDIYNLFEMPVKWLCFYVFLLIGLNNYPMNELQSKGYQILVHSKSRLRWWSSKIIWTVAFTAVYFAICILTVLTYSLANGAAFSFHASAGVMTSFSRAHFALCSSKYLIFVTMLLPFLFACLLGFLYLFLTNITKPMQALVVLICILVVSSYQKHWLLIGNLAMPYRMSPVQKHGIQPIPAFFLLFALSVIIIICGYQIFKRKDIFERAE